MKPTVIKQRFSPKHLIGYAMDEKTTLDTLGKFGINLPIKNLQRLAKAVGYAEDALPDMITQASTGTPVQFLQWFNPTVITMLTKKRDIDDLVGVTIAGTFADEQIVQPVIELLGKARPYGDKANPNKSSYNVNYEARTIVRLEESLEVGILEEEQAGKARLNSSNIKKQAVARVLEIARNEIGYNGYANGENKTYGFLNDPELPSYVTVADGVSTDTVWETKSFLEIQKDLLTAISTLQVQTGNNYNPRTDRATLAIALSKFQYLNKTNEFGTKTVMQWLNETYPLIEVKASVYLDGANGSENVFYLYANDFDGIPVVDQFVQDKLRLLGVQNKGKSFVEYYANATAGVFFTQPVGVVRYTGI